MLCCMSLMNQVPSRTAFAMLLFGVMAYLLALTSGDAGTRLMVRMAIELPVLLFISALASLLINTLAAAGGGLLGGSNLVAAILAGGLAWNLTATVTASTTIQVDTPLQLAHAVAMMAAWLVGGSRQTA